VPREELGAWQFFICTSDAPDNLIEFTFALSFDTIVELHRYNHETWGLLMDQVQACVAQKLRKT
jgi:hypothetical protein